MLKLIIAVTLSHLAQNYITADTLKGLERHGYPNIIVEQPLVHVSESLAKLIALSPRKAREKEIKAHLTNLLQKQGVTDATYWVSIVRGGRVLASDILKDTLPRLTREFRPNTIGIGSYRTDTEIFYVTVLVHRGGELVLSKPNLDNPHAIRLTGSLYPGYFQPKVVCASTSGPVTEYTPRLDKNRQFDLTLGPEVFGEAVRIELIAEHVSGPRVLNLMALSKLKPSRRLPVIKMERASTLKPARDLYERINQVRIDTGLPVLAWDDAMAKVAHTHARFISKRRALTHKATTHGYLRQRLSVHAIRPTYMAELLVSADSALEALDSIRMSPAHFQEIGNTDINTIGIGVENGYYVVILARVEAGEP